MFTRLIPLLLLSLTVGSPALAADGMPTPAERFLSVWDLDDNGEVTISELKTMRARVFRAFDQNADQVLDRHEYADFDDARAADVAGYKGEERLAMKKITGGMSLGRSDKNGDGTVSHKEFIDGAAGWLSSLDGNDDGVVTRDDIEQLSR